MLTAILKSKTIVSFVLSYLLGIGMLVYGAVSVPLNALGYDLLYSHWAFGWLEKSSGFMPYLCIIIISVMAVFSRVRSHEAKKTFGNRNLAMIALISLVMVQSNALIRPDVLAATFLSSASFMLLFSTHKQESVLSELFHVSLLIGLASLFVGQCVFLIVAVLFSILIFRSGKAKEWVVLVLGLAMVVVFVTMVTIWNDNPVLAFQRVIQSSWSGNMNLANLNLGHALILPAILAGLAAMFRSITAGTVANRNIALANAGWLVGVLFMVLILGLGWQNGIIFAAFPLSVFISKTLESIKRWWIADLLVLALIAAPFVRAIGQ